MASVFTFCHGTSVHNADIIRKFGLDRELAKVHQAGSTRPGAFHALQREHPGAVQLAYEFAMRQEPPHLILVGALPLDVFEAMRETGSVVVEPILHCKPTDPPQVVFFPQSYSEFNKHISWLTPIKPSKR